jgi:hypothetical protein
MTPIEMVVTPDLVGENYTASWLEGLMGFFIARKLLECGHQVERELIVRLQGADFELFRAPLGAAAATPLINYTAPVEGPARLWRVPRGSPP